MNQDIVSTILLYSLEIGIVITVIVLIIKYNSRMKDAINGEEYKSSNNLDHPFFKLSLTDAEKYLAEVYLKKMIYIIHTDISKTDPNFQDEIFSRTLVKFNEEFIDIEDAISLIYGPHYLNNFATNTFNQLLLNGDINKLVNKYAI